MKHLVAVLVLTLALASGCAPEIVPGPMKTYDIHIIDTGNAHLVTQQVISWGKPVYYYSNAYDYWIYCTRWPNGSIRYTRIQWNGVITDVTESQVEQ